MAVTYTETWLPATSEESDLLFKYVSDFLEKNHISNIINLCDFSFFKEPNKRIYKLVSLFSIYFNYEVSREMQARLTKLLSNIPESAIKERRNKI